MCNMVDPHLKKKVYMWKGQGEPLWEKNISKHTGGSIKGFLKQ